MLRPRRLRLCRTFSKLTRSTRVSLGSVWETPTKSLGILVFRLILSATEELSLPKTHRHDGKEIEKLTG